jgi:hypothetical protein
VAGCGEDGNGSSDFIKGGKIVDYLSDCQPLKKGSFI